MTAAAPGSNKTGLANSLALAAALLLLAVSPLMRGGNRHVALVGLELLGLIVLAGLGMRWFAAQPPESQAHGGLHKHLLSALLLSPLLLALVQLIPIPPDLWVSLPGRAIYLETLPAAGGSIASWRPASVNPDATAASLLASIPIVAAFLMGYAGSLRSLKLLLGVVVTIAFGEVLLGLLQIAGGQHSPLFVGVLSYGPPVGTFANRNHFANYLAMALAAYVWLAYDAWRCSPPRAKRSVLTTTQWMMLWAAGGLVLVLGILMSRSRGAALFGLPMAAVALMAVSLRVNGRSRGLRLVLPLLVLLVLGAAALVGVEALTSRISLDQLASSAGFRGTLTRTSLDAAVAFWPWGSGWGTYDVAYPRFQPLSITGYANHAHMDYVEMLLEGGIFFVFFAAAFLWLAGRRAHLLTMMARRDSRLDREAMAAALCGLGLAGLLLHSLVEFNMRIPANAILGALMAGAFLRPLGHHRPTHDRSSQPHPAGH